mmetsp:Transcript_2755/g.6010  ORF Transcript_2755/g.6010 Transcript_2755/m.6010 type:complete len:266 (-) Transcript_2755:599-1396(-)
MVESLLMKITRLPFLIMLLMLSTIFLPCSVAGSSMTPLKEKRYVSASSNCAWSKLYDLWYLRGDNTSSSGRHASSVVSAGKISSASMSCSCMAKAPPQPYSDFNRRHACWTLMSETSTLKPLPLAMVTFRSSLWRMTVLTQELSVSCLPTSASGIVSLLGSTCKRQPCCCPSFVSPCMKRQSPMIRTIERAAPRLLAGLRTLLPFALLREVSAVTTSSPVAGCLTTVGLCPWGWWPESSRLIWDFSNQVRTWADLCTGLPSTNGL